MAMLEGTVEKTVDLGDHLLAFSEGPQNGPPLVLVHGLTGRRDSFAPVLPDLLTGFHVFAIDQRGHGLSSDTPGHYALSDYSSDLIGLLRTLFAEPAFVWGQSLGAGVTLDAAGVAPDLFRAIVLEDPPLGESKSRTALHQIFNVWLKLAASGLSVDDIEQQLVSLDMQATGAAARYKAQTLHQLDPDVLKHAISGSIWADYDFSDAMRKVKCPAFLAQADPERGGIISDELLAALQPLPPNFTHQKFVGSGHKAHADQPDVIVDAALDFFHKSN